jgi:hypothetical protein
VDGLPFNWISPAAVARVQARTLPRRPNRVRWMNGSTAFGASISKCPAFGSHSPRPRDSGRSTVARARECWMRSSRRGFSSSQPRGCTHGPALYVKKRASLSDIS